MHKEKEADTVGCSQVLGIQKPLYVRSENTKTIEMKFVILWL